MFDGVFTAVVTPFKVNGEIDEPALQKLVDFQIEGGVQGLVPCGTTGESPALSAKEHIRVVKIVVEHVQGRVPVIAGCGSNCTREAIDLTKGVKEAGANVGLQVAPYYNKPTQKGFFLHFTEIAESVDIPLIIYNIPGRTGKNIENSTMLDLAQHRNIIGVKEASGDIAQIMELISKKPESFTVLSGDDNLVFPILALGGRGVISVASNLIPDRMANFVGAALEGQWERARKMHYMLLPFFKALFYETNPIPVKAGLAMKGMVKEVYRLPMCRMQAENRQRFEQVINDLNVI